MNRRSDSGRIESRAFGALAMLATFTGYIALHMSAGGAGDISNSVIVAPVVAGIVTYVPHQAAPFRQDIFDSVKNIGASVPNIGSGISNAFSRFGKAINRLGDALNLTDGARALKHDAAYIKSIMGVDSLRAVRGIAASVYGKQDANAIRS